ncbi:peptidase S8 and S53 subtilisin kexin sedolisin [Planctopirus limnophila DSM 3776]|uniref:Peptidase S8 and S53 subtilisin kexin sedolisin n=1 Tax=Planctopirus limnophila (strain ATCC 43296 / DSM 3776 / IFAM 1008 / Mu 290) TaxID=521674 RepID=D5SMM9_PLAL2|nr:S8 family peptidase [Planctopirus limnophila]ADG67934.1 peptidase S8 and S53 subtilisin kexin sedolisin [Planctopirus limnophila DSM 3776]
MPKIFLPMKVVLARKDLDYRLDPNAGGETKIFEPVTQELRKKYSSEVASLRKEFSASFAEHPTIPAVAKVLLKPEAGAKSYRPGTLFNSETCPIIGVEGPSELLVSVSSEGLRALAYEIEQGQTKKHQANISTLNRLLAFKAKDALEGYSPEYIAKTAKRKNAPIRIRLFRHGVDAVDKLIEQEFKAVARSEALPDLEAVDYGDDVTVYAVKSVTTKSIKALAAFVGTQSIGLFPEFRLVRTAANIVGKLDERRFPSFDPAKEYGLVGVIDSGTDPTNRRLQEYVARRDVVVKTQHDFNHGSFVAGLIANSRALNGADNRFPRAQSRVVDVVAIDASGQISEYDLITVIENAVRDHSDVRVWNLSLGQATPCSDARFSLLACKLDSIAKKRNVLFVIAAGNYETPPLRTWPPENLGENDRICPPADSVRGLTVGSIAHISNQSSCVGIDEPSGFSRRGPAPHFYIKPEVSHYGGNCDETGDCLQCGVVSTDGHGNLAENIGTSFAAPHISNIAANIYRELEPEGNLSPAYVKGLIAHSAFLRSGCPDALDVRYKGFGSPGDVSEILNCTQSSATVIFHAELTDRHFFEKHQFPMPSSLVIPNKGLRAEVFMTLAYDPPTDARFGMEYCRTNLTASLGTVMKNNETGKEVYNPQLRPAPKDVTRGGEARMVSEGFKWSPLKFYYRAFTAGPICKNWRLHLEILNRDGFRCKEPQKLVLLLTIRDPEGKANVYNEMVTEMEKLSWGAQDLRLASRIRVRRRS